RLDANAREPGHVAGLPQLLRWVNGSVRTHRLDGRHLEVLVDEDRDLAAVGLPDVRLVRRAEIDVGLDALDGAADLRERGVAHLGGGAVGQRRLALAVAADGRAGVPTAGTALPVGPPRRPS